VHGIPGLGAPHHLSDGYGMTSTAELTRMHITIVDYHEYRDFPELRVREAKAYVRLFFENYDYYNPGTSPDSLGAYLTWTTSALQFHGHSECFNLCRVAPVFGSAFSIGPSSHYDGVVGGLQDRLHLFLDHVRSILGLSGRKSPIISASCVLEKWLTCFLFSVLSHFHWLKYSFIYLALQQCAYYSLSEFGLYKLRPLLTATYIFCSVPT
jgi:hypothetical protein